MEGHSGRQTRLVGGLSRSARENPSTAGSDGALALTTRGPWSVAASRGQTLHTRSRGRSAPPGVWSGPALPGALDATAAVCSQLTRMRLFVALDLPDTARAALSAVEVGDGWRRVNPDSLHVTLAFLGTRPEDDIATITRVIQRETTAPTLTFGTVLLLPPRRPKVLTIELEEQGLAALQHRIAAGLADAGVYTPEKRPFRPHVTLARLRPRERPQTTELTLEPLTFHATAVTLYASRLHPTGARYEPLATAPLAAP